MSFKDEPFAKRVAKGGMGDLAEGVFEQTYAEGWVRYGINRPPINLTNVPAVLRYTPDYLTAKGLVEVQGFGADQTLKLKVDKLDALRQWTDFAQFDVHLFVYDSTHKQTAWVDVIFGLKVVDATLGLFDGTKQYLAWHKTAIVTDDGWHAL